MKRRDSEVEAYIFIRDKLEELGWDVRNPERHPGGQVYTQNQALEHDELQTCLGKDRPENIVKLSETKYWVIEAKNQRDKLDQAIEEAEEYAEDINKSDHIDAVIISGIAGNDTDKYVVENQYLEDGRFRTIKMNGRETSGLLSPEIAEQLLENDTAEIRDIPIDEDYFLQKAERINEILHHGSIHKNKRAQVMAALLLALINSDPKLDAPPKVLIQDINNRVEAELEKEGKPDFKHRIQISLPTSEDNHVKFRDAIVRTIRELKDLNIRSAMNSSTDVLGKFYEVFLKYGNGAKDIGIVLTPRHVTQYSAEVLDIDHNDLVYDPTCGTGGFLVAALDRVRAQSSEEQVNKFKEYNLFGIEQEPEVIALALVNMIFRGDGKTNIIEANCFHRHITSRTKRGEATGEFVDSDEDHDPPITKVLMNPPFSLKNKEERSYRFIDHALEDMEDGGVLFSVVPYSILVKQAGYRQFRDRLLENHTLLSVVTFPEDLFYPVGVHTAGIFVQKGQPHPDDQNVLWVRANRDGREKSKGKRLPDPREPNLLEETKTTTKAFVNDPEIEVPTEDKLQNAQPINLDDPALELVPEEYLTSPDPSPSAFAEQVDRFLEVLLGNLMIHIDNFNSDIFRASLESAGPPAVTGEADVNYREVMLTDLFEIQTGDYHVASKPPEGDIPLISCAANNNGITKPRSEFIYVDPPEENVYENCLTVAYNGTPLATRFHPYKFATKDDVAVLKPKEDAEALKQDEELSSAALIYIANAIELNKWRYNYSRKCYKDKMENVTAKLPVDEDGNIDLAYMESVVKQSSYFGVLESYINSKGLEATKATAKEGSKDAEEDEVTLTSFED